MARNAARSLDVTRGTIWKQLLRLSIPIFLSSIFQQSYALVDTFCVGRFAGAQALASVQAPWAVCDLAVGFTIGIGNGCAIVVGQLFGARRHREMAEGMHVAIGLALVMGVVFSLAGLLLARPVLVAMDTPADILAGAVTYARIYLGCLFFSILFNMGSALQRALGDTRTPSLIVAATCVINMGLDVVFVALLGLGSAGAALATGCSMAAGATLTLWTLSRPNDLWRFDLRLIRVEPQLAGRMLRCGLPLGLQNSAYGIANSILQISINGFGSAAVAAWGLSGRIDSVVWLVSDALAASVTTFAAQNYGARDIARMRRGLMTSLVLTALLVGTTSFGVWALGRPLAGIFVADETISSLTVYMLGRMAPFYMVFSLMDNIAGTIRGTGESVGPMVLTLVGTCALRVIWVLFVVPLAPSIALVLASYPVTWTVTSLMFVGYYLWGCHAGRW